MIVRKTACAALAALLALGIGCAALPPREDAAAAETSAARTTSTQLTTQNAALFLPERYEEYLPLEKPSSIAMCENFVAIADGTTLYLYERATGEYTAYTPTKNIASPAPDIGTINFSDDETLYFSVQGSLYRYDFSTQTATALTAISCSTFLIEGGYLYTGVIDNDVLYLRRYPMNNLVSTAQEELASYNQYAGSVYMAYAQGTLYYVTHNTTLYTYDTVGGTGPTGAPLDAASRPVNGLSSIACFNGAIYFSVDKATPDSAYQNGLYRYTSAGGAEKVDQSGAYKALTPYGENLYCIEGTSVREIAVSGGGAAFTDYEIAAASSSLHRLSGAKDTARAGNLLVTADAGNSRVSVYNFQTQRYSVLPCDAIPSIVATDGETIAYAAGTNIYTCTYGDTQFAQATLPTSLLQDISGLACVYGTVYYVTENGMRGSVGGEMVSSTGTPTGLAADLYGDLYVTYSNAEACKFTEEEFLTSGNAGTGLGFTAPAGDIYPEADFMGNLYYLSGGVLYKNGEKFADFAENFIWTEDGALQSPTAFALGFEDDEVYFNFGNYMVKSNAGTLADIPTLGEIQAEGARDGAFASHAPEGLLVTVPAGAVGVATDLSELRTGESAFFPYRGYARTAEAREGILLATTQSWSLILFAEGEGSYSASLYRLGTEQARDPASYYTAAEGAARYLSSEAGAYFAPCLESALTERRLARGTAVSYLGTVKTAELDYALIEYSDGARGSLRGYVPLSYLTVIPAESAAGENYTLAYLKSNKEGVLFTTATGEERLVTERTEVRLYANGDGTYTARLTEDLSYSAVITDKMIDKDNAEVVRIALIVILSVLALVILGVYIFLLPWEKYRKRGKNLPPRS